MKNPISTFKEEEKKGIAQQIKQSKTMLLHKER